MGEFPFIVISVVKLKSSFDLIIREFSAWVHSHQEVKMRPHEAKAEHFSKIDRTQAPDERGQKFIFHISYDKPVQGGP